MIIAIDFDGTIVSHMYPAIGIPNPGAIETMQLIQKKHKIILWTMRDGIELNQAVDYLHSFNIILWGINENDDQKNWTHSPKAYANIYIDDAALGCPLSPGPASPGGRPWVDWKEVNKMLTNYGII